MNCICLWHQYNKVYAYTQVLALLTCAVAMSVCYMYALR